MKPAETSEALVQRLLAGARAGKTEFPALQFTTTAVLRAVALLVCDAAEAGDAAAFAVGAAVADELGTRR
jgi:hypothetical protein